MLHERRGFDTVGFRGCATEKPLHILQSGCKIQTHNIWCEGWVTMAHMVDSRVCPRCQGFVHANQDAYGEYRECLQCGYMVDVVRSRDRTQPGPPRVTYSAPDLDATRSPTTTRAI